MKNYLLFTMYQYYPSGGWKDLNSSYDTLEEAKAAGEAQISEGYDRYHVVELSSGCVVSEGRGW